MFEQVLTGASLARARERLAFAQLTLVWPCAELCGSGSLVETYPMLLVIRGHHHTIDGTTAELRPATPLANGNPVPFYLAAHRQLVRDIEAGTLVNFDDIEIDAKPTLLALHRQQDS